MKFPIAILVLLSASGLALISIVLSAPLSFPESLVLKLFPQSVMSVVLQMTDTQKATFSELYSKQQNGSHNELNNQQAMIMFEELKLRDPVLFEMLWPVIMETKQKMIRMDEKSCAFFEGYLSKAHSLSPMLEINRESAIRQLLKFAVRKWTFLPEKSRVHFRREFPQMANVFEDTQMLRLVGVRV